MKVDPFLSSPFTRLLPVPWNIGSERRKVLSLTRTHGLRSKIHLQNLTSPANRGVDDPILIAYEVNGRLYSIYHLSDMLGAAYAFDEEGISNMRGDLAERVARRLMKRFLQRYDSHRGKLGGLFSKQFDPKHRENFVVSHTDRYVLKIGRYPNMILLERTGHGAWGYQHVTDLDGLFDYRYLGRRHLIIMESKIGKIDINAEALFETLFVPLGKLFPEATFTYALFASQDHLLDTRHLEYRVLQETPARICKALSKHKIPCLFFEFKESENEFINMCRHLITCHRTYYKRLVSFQGHVAISKNRIVIHNPGSRSPYMVLERESEDQPYLVVHPPGNPKPSPELATNPGPMLEN